MTEIDKSNFERLASGPLAIAAFTVATSTMGPIGALFGEVIKSKVAATQMDRVETAIKEFRKELSSSFKFDDISEKQYEGLGIIINVMLSTVDQVKINFLRDALINFALHPEQVKLTGSTLARIIRDISAPELIYLNLRFSQRPWLPSPGLEPAQIENVIENLHHEFPDTPKEPHDEDIIISLQSIGLIRTSASRNSIQWFDWTPAAGKLLTVIRLPETQ